MWSEYKGYCILVTWSFFICLCADMLNFMLKKALLNVLSEYLFIIHLLDLRWILFISLFVRSRHM
jgi:hypothetical protein